MRMHVQSFFSRCAVLQCVARHSAYHESDNLYRTLALAEGNEHHTWTGEHHHTAVICKPYLVAKLFYNTASGYSDRMSDIAVFVNISSKQVYRWGTRY